MPDGVILLHGIARTSGSMVPIAAALEGAGFAILNLDYRSRHLPLAALAEATRPEVRRFAAHGTGAVHIVAHSMGGLLARACLRHDRPARIGRVVTLGTPHGGSEVADRLHRLALYRVLFGPAGQQLTTLGSPGLRDWLGPVDYPLGVIAGDRPLSTSLSGLVLPGPNDGKVTVASTRLDGMADHLVVHTSHTRLLRHRPAIAATIAFLDGGRFPRLPAV